MSDKISDRGEVGKLGKFSGELSVGEGVQRMSRKRENVWIPMHVTKRASVMICATVVNT